MNDPFTFAKWSSLYRSRLVSRGGLSERNFRPHAIAAGKARNVEYPTTLQAKSTGMEREIHLASKHKIAIALSRFNEHDSNDGNYRTRVNFTPVERVSGTSALHTPYGRSSNYTKFRRRTSRHQFLVK